MKFKNPLLAIILFIAALTTAKAQMTGGSIITKEDYQYFLSHNLRSGTAIADTGFIGKISLREYCPTPRSQGYEGSCVGWALGYGVITIMRAKKLSLKNRSDINRLAMSAKYIYNQVYISCEVGCHTRDALDALKRQGICSHATFSNTTVCTTKPDSLAHAEAARLKIKGYKMVFDKGLTNENKKNRLRELLNEGKPLLVDWMPKSSFSGMTSGQKTWKPDLKDQNLDRHALCLIGFDDADQTFEFMNSRGDKWADGGFVRIKYDDLLNDSNLLAFEITELVSSENSNRFTGEVILRQPDGKFEDTDEVIFKETPVFFDAEKQIYRTKKPIFKLTDAFQMAVREVPQGRYVYFLVRDGEGKWQNFGKSETNTYTPEMTLPRAEGNSLRFKGEERMCVLYSEKAILDYDKLFEKLKTLNGDFSKDIQSVFGDVLAKPKTIKYETGRMGFECPKGKAVALMLVVEAR